MGGDAASVRARADVRVRAQNGLVLPDERALGSWRAYELRRSTTWAPCRAVRVTSPTDGQRCSSERAVKPESPRRRGRRQNEAKRTPCSTRRSPPASSNGHTPASGSTASRHHRSSDVRRLQRRGQDAVKRLLNRPPPLTRADSRGAFAPRRQRRRAGFSSPFSTTIVFAGLLPPPIDDAPWLPRAASPAFSSTRAPRCASAAAPGSALWRASTRPARGRPEVARPALALLRRLCRDPGRCAHAPTTSTVLRRA